MRLKWKHLITRMHQIMDQYCKTPLLPYILILHQNVNLLTLSVLELESTPSPPHPQARKERDRKSKVVSNLGPSKHNEKHTTKQTL